MTGTESSPGARWRRVAAYGILVLVPLTIVVLLFWVRGIKGPYWLALNHDPAYAYLLNSLLLVKGQPPALVEHPGTPLQLVGAAVIRVVHLFRGTVPVSQDVLDNPELYLRAIHAGLTGLYGLVLLLVGVQAFRTTQRIAAALLMQAPPLLAAATLPLETRVMPESLLMSVGLLFCLVVLMYVWNPARGDAREPAREDAHGQASAEPWRRDRAYSILFGALAGVGVATKLTFVPLALVPLMLVPRVRARLIYLLAAALAFLVATLPALPRYVYLVQWHAKWATHTGMYGRSGTGLFDPGNLGRLGAVLVQSRMLPIVFVSAVAVLVWLRRWERRRLLTGRARRMRRGLLALTIAAAVQALMLLKQPRFHYLVPILSCLGLGTIFLVEVTRLWSGWMRRVRVVLIVGLGLYVGATQLLLINRWRTVMPRTVEAQLEAHRQMERRFGGAAKVYFFRASSKAHAFEAASLWAGEFFSDDLRHLYPDSYLWYFLTGEYLYFGQQVSFDDIAAEDREVIFQGEAFDGHTHPGLVVVPPEGVVLEKVFAGKREALYRFNGFETDPEAPGIVEDGVPSSGGTATGE